MNLFGFTIPTKWIVIGALALAGVKAQLGKDQRVGEDTGILLGQAERLDQARYSYHQLR